MVHANVHCQVQWYNPSNYVRRHFRRTVNILKVWQLTLHSFVLLSPCSTDGSTVCQCWACQHSRFVYIWFIHLFHDLSTLSSLVYFHDWFIEWFILFIAVLVVWLYGSYSPSCLLNHSAVSEVNPCLFECLCIFISLLRYTCVCVLLLIMVYCFVFPRQFWR